MAIPTYTNHDVARQIVKEISKFGSIPMGDISHISQYDIVMDWVMFRFDYGNITGCLNIFCHESKAAARQRISAFVEKFTMHLWGEPDWEVEWVPT